MNSLESQKRSRESQRRTEPSRLRMNEPTPMHDPSLMNLQFQLQSDEPSIFNLWPVQIDRQTSFLISDLIIEDMLDNLFLQKAISKPN